jgi:trans-aconitate methyltransferase
MLASRPVAFAGGAALAWTPMKSPLEDTIWGATYGSTAAVQAAFDRFGPEYHRAILASGVPQAAAAALMPHLDADGQGIDLGCGSGVLGLALRERGLRRPLDGIDLSPVMLELARGTGAYRKLHRANLLLPGEAPAPADPYDFVVTIGLIGDYVPAYLALPYAVSLLAPGGVLAFAVESRSTEWHALERQVAGLGLSFLSETELVVPAAELVAQTYYFFVTRLGEAVEAQNKAPVEKARPGLGKNRKAKAA